jgi:peroxiredoxin
MKSALKTAALVAVVVAVAFAYVNLAEQKGYALQKGSEAPGFELPSLAGEDVTLESYRGRLVVLNFWATWCPPCVAEMPSLQRLERALGPEGLAVVTVSTDEDDEVLQEFVTRHGLTLPVLRDPGGRVASGVYRTTGYPETFVIDRDGTLLSHTIGPAEWDSAEALDHFGGLLGPTTASR